MKSQVTIAIALFTFVPASSLAETQAERDACIGDAFQVCWYAIPDRDRVAACLAQNIDRLSANCRLVMQPGLMENTYVKNRFERGRRAN